MFQAYACTMLNHEIPYLTWLASVVGLKVDPSSVAFATKDLDGAEV